jgi:SAM-dependent methyltransferase
MASWLPFRSTADYWERRYRAGGDSGAGSYDFFAEFKAEVINEFVRGHEIRTVIEFGCGDGNQLKLMEYPSYLGLDVSETAIAQCRELFAGDYTKRFELISDYHDEKADLTLSLDVIYHLVEDEVYERYMRRLFDASLRFVVIYSSNFDEQDPADAHVRHRAFTPWVERNAPQWRLIDHIPNRHPFKGDPAEGSHADFFIYELLG